MIDTHAHIDFEQYDQDREEAIRRAFDSGIERIINVGADEESSERSVKLANEHENIYAVVGIHPHEFNAGKNLDIKKLRGLAENKKVLAIGEIGLDNYAHGENPTTNEQKEKQRVGFIEQVKLAQKLNLPVVIHCRDAYDDVFVILSEMNLLQQMNEVEESNSNQEIRSLDKLEMTRFVFHCYGGSLDFTKKLLAYENIYFSFAGNITYAKPNSEVIEVIKSIPMEKIMLETDCPYLAPVPNRGKRNEPAYVVYVCEKIAEIKEISAKKVEELTDKNAKKFFKEP